MLNKRINAIIFTILIAFFLSLFPSALTWGQQEMPQSVVPEPGAGQQVQEQQQGQNQELRLRHGAEQGQGPGARQSQEQQHSLRQDPAQAQPQPQAQAQPQSQTQAQPQPRPQAQPPLPTQNFFRFLFTPKLVTMIVLAAVALILLLTGKMNNRLRIPFLVVATFLYGVSANLGLKLFSGFSMHPSPICAFTKPILYGLRAPMLALLALILFLSLVGPKLFCSYVCPVGAVQELIAMLADKLKIRRRKPSFRLSQTVRVLVFLLFIALSWTAIIHTLSGNRLVALSLYDYVNAFEGFKWNLQPSLLDNLFHFLPLLLTLGFAFFTYRPFCYFVCPVGLFTNILEQVAVFRVVKKKDACNDCQACAAKAPCPAVAEILKDAAVVPDCFACTVCTSGCPHSLLKFGVKGR